MLEAGLPTEVLEAEVRAMGRAARAAGVAIAGGDTKVVEHGKADRMYITTAGVGRPIPGVHCSARSARPGDVILLSGPIGDHGITILLARGELDLEADLCSDTRPVLPLVEALAAAAAPGLRWMRDPTRGGVATALNEFARDCGLGCPSVRRPRSGARCSPRRLRVARSGPAAHRQRRTVSRGGGAGVCRMPRSPRSSGRRAARQRGSSARCASSRRARCSSSTPYGGTRIVDMLVGDPLPRIC